MGIRVFVSNLSGSKEIKAKQEFIKHVLDCKKIGYLEVDITDPSNEEQKQFMRQTSTAKEGQNVPLPPQVYNDDQYLGDYDSFLDANESDALEEFLHMAPQKTTTQAEITLAEVKQSTADSCSGLKPNTDIVTQDAADHDEDKENHIC